MAIAHLIVVIIMWNSLCIMGGYKTTDAMAWVIFIMLHIVSREALFP